MRVVIELSSAVAYAVVLGRPGRFRDRHVGEIPTGGNVELDDLSRC